MSDDSLARTPTAAASRAGADYDAIHDTIVASERGRWFLDEYARRHRGADTERVLAAIARIEQALPSKSAAEPVVDAPNDVATMLQVIAQTRSEVVGRYGDPAASGEAALADFRNATEQIQELILQAQGRDSGLGAQLSFQINRLASAGERLERSVAGLRPLLALLEQLDQRLRNQAAGSVAEAADAALEAPPEPDSRYVAESTTIRIEPDRAREQPDSGPAEAHWDLTVAQQEAERDQAEASGDSESTITEWAFAPAEASANPALDIDHPLPPSDAADLPEDATAASPVSALERLEAREYARWHSAPPPIPDERAAAPEATETPWRGGLDDLILGDAATEDQGSGGVGMDEPADLGWIDGPTAAVAGTELPAVDSIDRPDETATVTTGEPLLDADLFEREGDDDTAATSHEVPAAVSDIGTGPAEIDALEMGGEMAPEKERSDVRPPEPSFHEDDTSDAWRSRSATFVDEMTTDPLPDAASAVGSDGEAAGARQTRLPPLPDWPAPLPERAASGAPPASDANADVPTVLQRLESVRTAIAALMDEVNEKAARRNPQRS
jgi:hypothetical protein